MKRTLLVCLIVLGAMLHGRPASMEMSSWSNGYSFLWKNDGASLENVSSDTLQRYLPAPYSRECSISAEVTPLEVLGSNWKTVGFTLSKDPENYWKFNFAAYPTTDNDTHRPFFELAEGHKGAWPYSKNTERLEFFERKERWRYGETYRMSMSLKGDILKAEATLPDGTLVYKCTYKLNNEATRIVRPCLSAGNIRARFSKIDIETGRPVGEVPGLARETIPPYECSSYVESIKEKATGYFYTKKMEDGRWWVIDPLGRGFVVFGIDHCVYQGHYCEKLGLHPHKVKNDKRFKNREEWAQTTLGYLKDWGFNILSAGTSGELHRRGLATAPSLGIGGGFADLGEEYEIMPNLHRPCTAFPNVFHPAFREYCAYRIQRTCLPNVNDPWIFGYFIDNELCWWGGKRPDTGLFNATMGKGKTHTAKIALRDFLKAKAGNSVSAFNAFWKTEIKDFDELLEMKELPEKTDEQRLCKRDFLELCAEKYFGIVAEEFRKVDKNHMLMACRFAGIYAHDELVWRTAGKYNDIITWNFYGHVDLNFGAAFTGPLPSGKPLAEAFGQVYEWIQRPTIITEWSFPALDAGLPSTRGAGQRFRTQAERAKATDIYARTLLSMPFMVGYDYFMWVDEPALGISENFPENSNYGMINEDFQPYPEMVKVFKAIQNNPGEARYRELPKTKEFVNTEYGRLYARMFKDGLKNEPMNDAFKVHLREGRGFSVSNGRLTLVNRGKNADVEVSLDGKKFGIFNVMLQFVENGKMVWQNADRIDGIDVRGDGNKLVMDVLATRKSAQGESGTFTFAYRLSMFPGDDWFASEIVSVKNLQGDEPLEIGGVFFRLYPSFKITTSETRNEVPHLWSGSKKTGWISERQDQYMGVTTLPYMDIRLHFWYGTGADLTTFHPDAFRVIKRTLKPLERYGMESPLYIYNFFGKGNSEDSDVHASKIVSRE